MRDRRRRGFRCATVEVSPIDVGALISAGLLDHRQTANLTAIEAAIGAALDRLSSYT